MVVSTDTVFSASVIAGTANGRTIPTDHRIARLALVERTNSLLLEIVKRHLNTQYATQAPSLSAFRDAVSAHGGTKDDATLLADFWTHVPLSTYDSYKTFVDRFHSQPCKKEDVENLLAPGFPEFLSMSSSTTGTPKILARYPKGAPSQSQFFDPNSKTPIAAVIYCGCMAVKEVVDASGKVVERIPNYLGTGRMARVFFGWEPEGDERRMSMAMSYYAVPWAATTIAHLSSFLTIHGLFFLTHRDVDRIYVPFATLFIDLIRYMNEQWDVLVHCIKDGILPDLEGTDDVREYLQAHLHADPERAAELLEIGPPFSREGWVTHVWPQVKELCTTCTGPWSLMLPKVRSIVGPNILISTFEYGSSESKIGSPHDVNKPDEFVLPLDKLIEFLDVSQPDALENLRQPWEVEVGGRYEPILTTKHGLWRYHLGDIVSIIGFHPERNSPIFKYLGRKSVKIHLPHAEITDYHVLEAIKLSNSEDTIVVQEYTTVVDDRASAPTVGLFVELSTPPGPNAHLAPQKLFDALVATDSSHLRAFEDGQIRLPTIRIVKPGTFAEFRCWRGQVLKRNSGQIKVPSVLVDPTMREWILKWVVEEL